jgi:hypothetical protein
MSTAVIFNSEMKKYFDSNKSEIAEFINEKFVKSKYETYNGFFDNFLYEYGIISFSSDPLEFGHEYIPSVNCTDNNIFKEKKGITDLSTKSHSLNDCQKIFAKYFISKFNNIDLKTLTEWNSENNRIQ